jgi:sulfatase modifying factor 1
MMNNEPLKVLIEIISRDSSLAFDPRRCRAMLNDCLKNGYRKEVNLLVYAIETRGTKILLEARNTRDLNSLPDGEILKRAITLLESETGLRQPESSWAIESWAIALGFDNIPNYNDNIKSYQSSDNAKRNQPDIKNKANKESNNHTDYLTRKQNININPDPNHWSEKYIVTGHSINKNPVFKLLKFFIPIITVIFIIIIIGLAFIQITISQDNFPNQKSKEYSTFKENLIEPDESDSHQMEGVKDELKDINKEEMALSRKNIGNAIINAITKQDNIIENDWHGQAAGERKVINLGTVDFVFRWCPAGRVIMGSPPDEISRSDDENQFSLEIKKGFWIMETEVTQKHWREIMKIEPEMAFYGDGDQFPVYNVTYEQAVEFVTRLSKDFHDRLVLPSDMRVSLPTEYQWEYACRAGTTTAYYFGNNQVDLNENAWFADNSGDLWLDANRIWLQLNEPKKDKFRKIILGNGCKTHPVATKKPNLWGLFDMSGNLWEWCASWDAGERKVIRGGGWDDFPSSCRSANRYSRLPNERDSDIGFRVIIEDKYL